MDSRLKKCCDCKVHLSLDNFGVDKSRYDKLNSKCFSCRRARTSKYYQENSEKVRAQAREAYNPAYGREKWQRFYTSGKDKLRNSLRKPYLTALNAKRRTLKYNACPSWLSEDQRKKIEEFYWLAKDLKAVTGEEYHVDHIVPIQGKHVCGLHVPWNLQVLPKDVNLRKSNK